MQRTHWVNPPTTDTTHSEFDIQSAWGVRICTSLSSSRGGGVGVCVGVGVAGRVLLPLRGSAVTHSNRQTGCWNACATTQTSKPDRHSMYMAPHLGTRYCHGTHIHVHNQQTLLYIEKAVRFTTSSQLHYVQPSYTAKLHIDPMRQDCIHPSYRDIAANWKWLFTWQKSILP